VQPKGRPCVRRTRRRRRDPPGDARQDGSAVPVPHV